MKIVTDLKNDQFQTSIKSLNILDDFHTFVDYIQGHKVRVTKAKHLITSRHLHAIDDRLTREPLPPNKARTKIKMRNEQDIHYIMFCDALAHALGIVEEDEGNVLETTDQFNRFKALANYQQLFNMVLFWWFNMNWEILISRNRYIRTIQDNNSELRGILENLQPDEAIDFERFSLRILRHLKLSITPEGNPLEFRLFQQELEQTILIPLEWFGAAEVTRKPQESVGQEQASHINSFKITSLGGMLIKALYIAEERETALIADEVEHALMPEPTIGHAS